MQLFTFLMVLIVSFNVKAHQPKILYSSPTLDVPHVVTEPEISKAFYGKLKGEPHYYKITSNESFLFYAGISTPKLDEEPVKSSFTVYDGNNQILFQAKGEESEWTSWYEPYAKDYYWLGPRAFETNAEEKSVRLEAGDYTIKVYNADNSGTYVLAVGENDFFGNTLWEKVQTWTPIILYISPYMDRVYWKKLDVRAYIPHIFLVVLLFGFYWCSKFIFRKFLKA